LFPKSPRSSIPLYMVVVHIWMPYRQLYTWPDQKYRREITNGGNQVAVESHWFFFRSRPAQSKKGSRRIAYLDTTVIIFYHVQLPQFF
jgi:hypothetical protein